MYIILTIIGCVIGYFYISAGFSQKDKPDSLKDDPRVKNLLWIIGPSVCIFTTDWNQYVSDINKTELFKCYIGGVLGGIILTLLLTFIYIYLEIKELSKTCVNIKKSSYDLYMTYMYHGYNKYRERVSSIMSSQNVSKEEIIPEILDKVGKSIATAYAYARGALNRHDLEEIQGGTKKVMGAMADVVRLIAPNSDQLNINVNFMLKVPEPPSDVPPEFMIHKKESYSSFLLLIRYDNGNGFRICLPLESSTKTNYSLPNAPACFAEGEPKLLNKNKIKFQSKVPKDVQEQVRKFFSESKYESVLSLPLCLAQGSNESIGVVNIESNRIDIIGKGSKQTLRIANSLAPLCLILATLAEAERKML